MSPLQRPRRTNRNSASWSGGTQMKAAVVTEKGVEVRDVEKPKPGTQPGAGARARRRPQPRRSGHGVGPHAWQHRRAGHRARARVRGRGRGGRQRGEGGQARRPRDVLGQRRLRRVCRRRLGPRVADPGQQHELRAGGDAADRAADHAQRPRHRGPAQGRRGGDDPGRQLRRRPDGAADRQAQGRAARRSARRPTPARRERLKEFGADLAIDTTRAELVGAGARRRPTARASTSSSTRSRPASPTRT